MKSSEIKFWIQKAQRRDKDAFTELMEFYMKDMYRTAIAILMNEEDAADALQDTILTCWEKLYTLKKPEFFKTWLIRILINQCKAVLQKQKRYVLTEEMDERELEENSFSDVYFRDILSELSQKDQWIFTLYYEEGYTTKQIAKIIDMKENTIISRLNRGRKKLFLSFARNCQ